MKARHLVFPIIFLLITHLTGFSQNGSNTEVYDPHLHKIIPDKVFEIGLPLLFLLLVANTLVAIFKTKAENRLKEKAIDKGISEPTLVTLFADDKKLNRLIYFKWFLILAGLGISLLIIQLFKSYFQTSGYYPIAIIIIFQAIAFLIYYRVIKDK